MRIPFLISLLLLVAVSTKIAAQDRTISLGIFTGATSTYSWDEGINKDSRYENRYDIKFSPIGIAYGIDYEGFGFILTPSLINVGQKYHVINTVGGSEGTRSAAINYLNIPLAFKLHIIDLSFFKVSFVAGGSAAILLNGKETVSHHDTKLKFPSAVYPILPADYQVEYDGVVSPVVNNYQMLGKSDYEPLQLFVCAGFRSDWDVTDLWRVSFDIRANYGLLEPRSPKYLERLNANQTLYDVPGKRRDIVAYLNVGIARYIDIDVKEQNRKKSRTSAIRYRR